MRIKQERHEARLAEIWLFGDLLEGWGIGVGLPLTDGDHMARRTPQLRHPHAVRGVGGQRGRTTPAATILNAATESTVTAVITKENPALLMLTPLLEG
jgi:hypothetical protein